MWLWWPTTTTSTRGGCDARGRWEARWDGDYSDKPDEGVAFSWSRISEAMLATRVRECREEDPELDWVMVERLSQRIAGAGVVAQLGGGGKGGGTLTAAGLALRPRLEGRNAGRGGRKAAGGK